MKIPKKYHEPLRFILSEFISTHESSSDIYPEELDCSKEILKSLTPNP